MMEGFTFGIIAGVSARRGAAEQRGKVSGIDDVLIFGGGDRACHLIQLIAAQHGLFGVKFRDPIIVLAHEQHVERGEIGILGDARVAAHELTVRSDGEAAVLGLHRAVGIAQTCGGRCVRAIDLRKVEKRRIRVDRVPILGIDLPTQDVDCRARREKGVAGRDDNLQRIRTIRRWDLVGVHVEIVIDELAERIGVGRTAGRIVEVLVVSEDGVADHARVGTRDRRVGRPRGEVGGRNPHFIASRGAERWMREIVPGPVNGIADDMIETERAVGNQRTRSVLCRVWLIHDVGSLPDELKSLAYCSAIGSFCVVAIMA